MKKTPIGKANTKAMKTIAKAVKPQVKSTMNEMCGKKNPFDKKAK